MEAESREVGAEARRRTGDAEVRHQREPEAAADSSAVNRRDDRLACAKQADRLDIEMPGGSLRRLARHAPRAIERAAVAEIGAGAERLALRGKHHGAAGVVLVERLQRAGDLADQRDVEEVVGRPADLDERHQARRLDRGILEPAHLTSLHRCPRMKRSRSARYSAITRMVRAQLRALVNSGYPASVRSSTHAAAGCV